MARWLPHRALLLALSVVVAVVATLLARPGAPGAPIPGARTTVASSGTWAGLELLRLRGAATSRAPIFDSLPDAEVGLVLRPSLHAGDASTLDTNLWGMRERAWYLEPAKKLRVVLLGGAHLLALGVAREDRVGSVLAHLLEDHAGAEVDVEVLQIGLPYWNLQAQCTFLRRSLVHLSPDLVVHLPELELGDTPGVRGIGTLADFSPQVRERADGLVSMWTDVEGARVTNHLPLGLDQESRERYSTAAESVARLVQALRALDSSYLMLSDWGGLQPLARETFSGVLGEGDLAFLPDDFTLDPSRWQSATDPAWTSETHAHVAKLLFGWILQRQLLPALELEPWDEAEALVGELHGAGLADAHDRAPLDAWIDSLELAREITFPGLDRTTARQVYGGVRGTRATPYVSLLLPGAKARELVVRGERLGRRELLGRARVYVEEFEVGGFGLVGSRVLAERFALPPEVAERRFLNVRIVSDDYLFTAPFACAAFELTSVQVR